MPNNPGRIDGDYSIGEKEEIKYAAPPQGFGTVKKSSPASYRQYAIAAVVIIVILALFMILRL